jgi:hypothetical protein
MTNLDISSFSFSSASSSSSNFLQAVVEVLTDIWQWAITTKMNIPLNQLPQYSVMLVIPTRHIKSQVKVMVQALFDRCDH